MERFRRGRVYQSPFALSSLSFSAAIKLLNDSGWLAIVVTNQAGVARGYFAEDMIQTIHETLKQEMAATMRESMRFITALIIRRSETSYRFDCDCRKPKPGLIRVRSRGV